MSSINFLWGCDPSVQFEVSWILSLLADKNIAHFDLYTNLQPLLPNQRAYLPYYVNLEFILLTKLFLRIQSIISFFQGKGVFNMP